MKASKKSFNRLAFKVFGIFGPGMWNNPKFADKALRLVEETPYEYGISILWALEKIPVKARHQYRKRIQKIADNYGIYVQKKVAELAMTPWPWSHSVGSFDRAASIKHLKNVHEQIHELVPPLPPLPRKSLF
jgi:hypothetical protein